MIENNFTVTQRLKLTFDYNKYITQIELGKNNGYTLYEALLTYFDLQFVHAEM